MARHGNGCDHHACGKREIAPAKKLSPHMEIRIHAQGRRRPTLGQTAVCVDTVTTDAVAKSVEHLIEEALSEPRVAQIAWQCLDTLVWMCCDMNRIAEIRGRKNARQFREVIGKP